MGPEEVEELLLLTDLFRGLKHSGGVGDVSEPLKRDILGAGLGMRHARLLLTLAVTGPLAVGELAAKMGLAAPTVSLLAGEANRAGFLTVAKTSVTAAARSSPFPIESRRRWSGWRMLRLNRCAARSSNSTRPRGCISFRACAGSCPSWAPRIQGSVARCGTRKGALRKGLLASGSTT